MKPQLKQRAQFSLVYLVLAALVLSVVQSWLLAPRTVEIPMSQFLQLVREDKVVKVSSPTRKSAASSSPGPSPRPPKALATASGSSWAPKGAPQSLRPPGFPAWTTRRW